MRLVTTTSALVGLSTAALVLGQAVTAVAGAATPLATSTKTTLSYSNTKYGATPGYGSGETLTVTVANSGSTATPTDDTLELALDGSAPFNSPSDFAYTGTTSGSETSTSVTFQRDGSNSHVHLGSYPIGSIPANGTKTVTFSVAIANTGVAETSERGAIATFADVASDVDEDGNPGAGAAPPQILRIPLSATPAAPQYVAVSRNSTKAQYVSDARGTSALQVNFGSSGDIRLGIDTTSALQSLPMIYRPSEHRFYRAFGGTINNADTVLSITDADFEVFGAAGDTPLAGAFTVSGDGQGAIEQPAVYRSSTKTFYIDNGPGNDATPIPFGSAGDIPLVGHWTANAPADSVGVYRPSTKTFYLQKLGTDDKPNGIITVPLGTTGDTPIVGDWDGNGVTDIGVKRGNIYYLGANDTTSTVRTTYGFGVASDRPYASWGYTRNDYVKLFTDAKQDQARPSAHTALPQSVSPFGVTS